MLNTEFFLIISNDQFYNTLMLALNKFYSILLAKKRFHDAGNCAINVSLILLILHLEITNNESKNGFDFINSIEIVYNNRLKSGVNHDLTTNMEM